MKTINFKPLGISSHANEGATGEPMPEETCDCSRPHIIVEVVEPKAMIENERL
jgi:hypothetical protein